MTQRPTKPSSALRYASFCDFADVAKLASALRVLLLGKDFATLFARLKLNNQRVLGRRIVVKKIGLATRFAPSKKVVSLFSDLAFTAAGIAGKINWRIFIALTTRKVITVLARLGFYAG